MYQRARQPVEEQAPTCDDSRSDDTILRDAATRLVWTRLHEVEALKTQLQDLATAIARAEEVRQRIETLIDHDQVVALDVASSKMKGSQRCDTSSRFLHSSAR